MMGDWADIEEMWAEHQEWMLETGQLIDEKDYDEEQEEE